MGSGHPSSGTICSAGKESTEPKVKVLLIPAGASLVISFGQDGDMSLGSQRALQPDVCHRVVPDFWIPAIENFQHCYIHLRDIKRGSI